MSKFQQSLYLPLFPLCNMGFDDEVHWGENRGCCVRSACVVLTLFNVCDCTCRSFPMLPAKTGHMSNVLLYGVRASLQFALIFHERSTVFCENYSRYDINWTDCHLRCCPLHGPKDSCRAADAVCSCYISVNARFHLVCSMTVLCIKQRRASYTMPFNT